MTDIKNAIHGRTDSEPQTEGTLPYSKDRHYFSRDLMNFEYLKAIQIEVEEYFKAN